MISSAVARAKNYSSRFRDEAKKRALGMRDATVHRAGLVGRFLFNAVGGWRTIEIVRRILAYLCVLVVVIVVAACLFAASFGIAVVFAFLTRQYILYDLPVSSVHQVHDWTPVPSLSERWRLYQEVDDLSATASSSLLSSLGKAIQQHARGDACGSQTADGSCASRHPHALADGSDVVETALASLYRRVNTVKLVSAEQAASALVGTGSIRLQPTGWRTRNNWNSPLEFDEAVEDPDAAGDGADGSAHVRKAASSGSWFVNEDAIFLPSGPRFSQTASYSSTLRVVSACPSGAGSAMALEATMLIAADDRPQPDHKLQPLFRKTRTVVVPGQHFFQFAVRWAWQTALYIPFLCVNFLSSLIVWRTDDQALIAASMLAPGECSVDVPLYASFAPPKELLQRLRLVNFTLLSSSSSSSSVDESLPAVQVRRLFFFHNVEHFGLAYLFSEYPLITMWIATVAWFCVLVSLIVSGTLAIVVIGYRTVYGTGDRDDAAGDGDGRRGRNRRGRAGRGEDDDDDDVGERTFGRRPTTPPPFSAMPPAGTSTGEVLRRRRSVSLR